MDTKPAIHVISGPMAAGKSTVARLLAARFARAVCLEGDMFQHSIVRGHAAMTPDASPEAVEQLQLRYRVMARAADAYAESGFAVVVEDVVAGRDLGEYQRRIRHRPCHLVVLLPSREAIASREDGRDDRSYTQWNLGDHYEVFSAATPRVGVWLDTSNQSPDETVETILEATSSAPRPR